jgi:hypothetical protein
MERLHILTLPIDIQELIWRKSFDMCLKDIESAYQHHWEQQKDKERLYNKNMFIKAYRMDGKYQILCLPIEREESLKGVYDLMQECFDKTAILDVEYMFKCSFIDRFNDYQDKYKTDPNLIMFNM